MLLHNLEPVSFRDNMYSGFLKNLRSSFSLIHIMQSRAIPTLLQTIFSPIVCSYTEYSDFRDQSEQIFNFFFPEFNFHNLMFLVET